MLTEYLPALVAIVAIVATVVLDVRADRRENALRRKLGASRTALEACEAERDQMRRQFNAQAVELARYRGAHSASDRLTQVFTGAPEPPPPRRA